MKWTSSAISAHDKSPKCDILKCVNNIQQNIKTGFVIKFLSFYKFNLGYHSTTAPCCTTRPPLYYIMLQYSLPVSINRHCVM